MSESLYPLARAAVSITRHLSAAQFALSAAQFAKDQKDAISLVASQGGRFTVSGEVSALNRLIVAEEDGPVERRYSFPVGILLGR